MESKLVMSENNIYSSFINGEWRRSSKLISILNPSTNKCIGKLCDVGKKGAVDSINSASKAFLLWSKVTNEKKSDILNEWFRLIILNKNELARIVTLETGKPMKESIAEVDYGASFIKWFAEQTKRVSGNILSSPDNKKMLVIKQPIGVVSAITPWNFPIAMVTRKASAAIAAGCTVVLKPSELTSISALKLAELSMEAGLPKGVLNVVTGKPEEIGKVLSTHVSVKKITFTGSTKVGKYLMKNASSTVKGISLELGGNAPFIIFDDANLDSAVEGLIAAKFRNAGQTCISANRIFVQRNVSKKFIIKLRIAIDKLVIGDGFNDSDIGPLISIKALTKVKDHINDALKKGSKLLCGGKSHKAGKLFFEPTILTNVKSNMKVFSHENFGPIIPIINFDDDQEVINLANQTQYGLAAYFFTKKASRIWFMSENLEYGMFGINTGKISSYLNPFGGLKESGIGREGSIDGLEPFLETKFISWDLESNN